MVYCTTCNSIVRRRTERSKTGHVALQTTFSYFESIPRIEKIEVVLSMSMIDRPWLVHSVLPREITWILDNRIGGQHGLFW